MYLGRKIATIVVVIVAILAIGGIWFFWDDIVTPPPVEPYCGDGICSNDENCTNCPEDCGPCPPPEHCGNGICEPELGENCKTCSEDCGDCPPDSPGLGFRLPYSPVYVGDQFFVDVYLDPTGDTISFWKISVSFDSDKLRAIGVSAGDSIWMFDAGTVGTGLITDIQAWTMGAYPNYKTDLCTIKFEALVAGSANLDFASQKIGGSDPEVVITITEFSNWVIIN